MIPLNEKHLQIKDFASTRNVYEILNMLVEKKNVQSIMFNLHG